MAYELTILSGAEVDLLNAYARYEDTGLATRFYDETNRAFSLIELYPRMAPVSYRDFRRKLIASFPYGIFYRVMTRRVLVFAVLDLRQNPEIMRKRLT